jgi:hypothetical protein
MDDRGRRKTHWGRLLLRAVALAAAWSGASGCLGPKAISYTRLRYNEVVRATNDQQLLVNIVRLRYADSPVFIDLPNITSQFELSSQATYLGGRGNQFNGQTNLGSAALNARDTPTLSYHPREGREIAKAMLNPLSTDFFSVVNAGADIEQLLLLTINDIDDVPNAPRATTLTPRVPEDNSEFVRGIRLLADLRARDATELAFETDDEDQDASDPIPRQAVQGRDLLNAARDGYVYRARGPDQMTVVKREKNLVLKIRPAYVRSPEMAEVARIFRMMPGLSKYRIKSELAAEAPGALPKPMGEDTVTFNLRSVLQIMTFLSKGVCVPEEHVRSGIAPSTPGPDGLPFDWTRVTAGHFFVVAQKHKPHQAEVAVPYRGYWFYIAANDTNSRAILAILEVLFALQESDGKNVGPLLTLPLGG